MVSSWPIGFIYRNPRETVTLKPTWPRKGAGEGAATPGSEAGAAAVYRSFLPPPPHRQGSKQHSQRATLRRRLSSGGPGTGQPRTLTPLAPAAPASPALFRPGRCLRGPSAYLPGQALRAARGGLRPKGRRPLTSPGAGPDAGRVRTAPSPPPLPIVLSRGRPAPHAAARHLLTALVRAAAPLSSGSLRPSPPSRQPPPPPLPPSTLTLSQAAGLRPEPPPPAPPPAPHLLLLRLLLQQGPSCWSASPSSSASSAARRSLS